jgi:Rrf2 family transcriptional regulator, iron-sulfur cluster assembly transcription factor
MFSKACEYGIRATIYIGQQSQNGKRVSLADIANQVDSPVAFTAKILQKLVHNDIVDSLKGPTGGFEVSETHMKTVKLIHIVKAIDGEHLFTRCGLGLKECSELKPCPIHDQYKVVKEKLIHLLQHTSIYDLANGLSSGHTFLKT